MPTIDGRRNHNNNPNNNNHHHHPGSFVLFSSSSLSASVPDTDTDTIVETETATDVDVVMGGVAEFEAWFQSIPGANCDPTRIAHERFGTNLRGLAYKTTKNAHDTATNKKTVLMTIPKSLVLESDFNVNANLLTAKSTAAASWDGELAYQFWCEVRKGRSSPLYGYTSLLTKGTSGKEVSYGTGTPTNIFLPPPPTAPDALRHWTPQQKQWLVVENANENKNDPGNAQAQAAGHKVLKLEQQQMEQWRTKYATSIKKYQKEMTWEQFVWSMEVVTSRAFCGNFGFAAPDKVPISPLIASVTPVLAAIAGYFLYAPGKIDDTGLLGFAVLAAIPSLVNFVAASRSGSASSSDDGSGSGVSAVLLPFIDSANHLEEAASLIEYNPFSNSFTLTTTGSNCYVQDNNDENPNSRTQLFISYGKKKNTELLLNYGFLPGVSIEDGNEDERRKKLATAFLLSAATE